MKSGGRPPSVLPTTPTPTVSNFSPDTGSAGTIVTINGFNFSDDSTLNTVKFNGKTAEIISASPTSLTVIVPAGAISGRISVTVKGKTSTSIGTFTMLTGIWTSKADFGGSARSRAVAFSIGDKAYILNGHSAAGEESDFWEYDAATDQWTEKASFGGLKRERCVAFSIGDKGYVGLGYNSSGGEQKDFWEYDPASDLWTRKTDFPGKERQAAIAFGFADVGYVGLGINTTTSEFDYRDFWKYQPSNNQWTRMTDFPGSAVSFGSAAAVGNLGFVVFGLTISNPAPTTEFWQYDTATNSWLAAADFPGKARVNGTAFAIKGKLYAGFGSDLVNLYSDFWEYNPGNFTWTIKATSFAAPRFDLVGFSIGDHGYIGTGDDGSPNALKDIWQFTP